MEISNFSIESFEKSKIRILKIVTNKITTQDTPKAFILGGQPGAGKTRLQNIFFEQCCNNIIAINGDEFRKYHPNFDLIVKEFGNDAVLHTQKFAGQMTEALINELSNKKYNLIIEGTLRTAEVPLNTENLLKLKDYNTELSIIVVKPELSYLSTILRCERMLHKKDIPRATPKEHHDKVVNALPTNLEKIYTSKKFDNITLYNRNGDCLYNLKETPQINPTNIIYAVYNGDWTKDELKNLYNDISETKTFFKERNSTSLDSYTILTNNIIKKVENKINTLKSSPNDFSIKL